ncbi:hypothetical protein SAMN04487970_103963 [Paenibacillus tianmuensis]|uniref:Uncharacterized protein n=1 Tax=Paenibacillus tianmuensis TaxID=624147 RepID=A0A1G4T2D0_9BACL|nr:hypothetical protein [Paenibacillus tianmuensis]SCW74975.1 hypothetical protein SAMN04487970_103963 [Paenibacillus tianmuensis]
MSKARAKELAARYGFKLRAVANSLKYPNGYVKVIYPDGSEQRASDWMAAMNMIRLQVHRKRK